MTSPNQRPNPQSPKNSPEGHSDTTPSASEHQEFPTTYNTDPQAHPQPSQRSSQPQPVTVADKFVQTVYYLVGSLEGLLALRFLLRLSAANRDNTFANFIYSLSDPFVSPFSTLFISPTFNGSRYILDINLLVAMAAYLVLMVLVVRLIRILANR